MAVFPGIIILSCRLLFFLISSHESVVVAATSGRYNSIICFGDSSTDTGNLFSQSNISNPPNFLRPPYGETFFGRPTGRFSDGRIIVDFMAEALKLPLVSPYFDEKGETRKELGRGVNYAVGGATALDSFPWSVSPLRTQMGWFRKMIDPLCHKSPDYCKKILGDSLILMGEIGLNDYYKLLRNGSSIEVVQKIFVPKVVQTISSSIEELIQLGATTLMVPGIFPLGCSSTFLTYFQSSNKKEYDRFGCLKPINKFFQYHNQMLENQINQLRNIHPHTKIIYADYYNALAEIYNSPEKFGFKRLLSACCGGGGPYNFNPSILCGDPLSTTCDDPSSYIIWDGHLTEVAYQRIAQGILEGPYAYPPLRAGCPIQAPILMESTVLTNHTPDKPSTVRPHCSTFS